MNLAYAKVFESLFDGSLRGKPDAILVWVNILTHTRNGIADIHFRKISDETGLDVERVKCACLLLEKPDPDSRTPDEQGCRLIRMDDHRDWGWRIVNARKYREFGKNGSASTFKFNDGREGGSFRKGYVYYAGLPGDTKIKIGFSANPWSRIKELEFDYAGCELLAIEKGTYQTETDRHFQFRSLRIEREWFKYEGELRDYVVTLRKVAPATPASVPASASASEVELPQNFPKTEKEAASHAAFIGCDEQFAASVWNKAMGRGGRDAKDVPIRLWRNHLATEWSYEQERRAKSPGVNGKVFPRDIELQMKAIQKEIDEHPANPQSVCYKRGCDDLTRNSLRALREKLKSLNVLQANGGIHA